MEPALLSYRQALKIYHGIADDIVAIQKEIKTNQKDDNKSITDIEQRIGALQKQITEHQQHLSPSSKDYDNFNKINHWLVKLDEYSKKINTMSTKIIIPSQSQEVKEASQEVKEDNPGQSLLLRYDGKEELAAIKEAAQHPNIEVIGQHIKKGEWEKLLKDNLSNKDFSIELLAAFCEKKISLDELTTAMTFDVAYSVDPESKIIPMEEENLKFTDIPEKERPAWLELSSEVPPNLRYFITSEVKKFDDRTNGIIRKSFFVERRIPGVFKAIMENNVHYGMVSFALAKAWYQHPQSETNTQPPPITLVPILHLSPDKTEMIDRILKQESDFAIFLRGEAPVIHGSNNLLFGCMHDIFHTYARAERVSIQTPFVNLAENIEKKLLNKYKGYESKLSNGHQQLFRQFVEKPTLENAVGYALERISGELIDGSYHTYVENDPKERLNSTLKDLIKRVVRDELCIFLDLERWSNMKVNFWTIRKQVEIELQKYVPNLEISDDYIPMQKVAEYMHR